MIVGSRVVYFGFLSCGCECVFLMEVFLQDGANKGGVDAALAVAAAASTMLKKRLARRKQEEMDETA